MDWAHPVITHQHIANAAQIKGFRDRTITQMWVPIHEYHVDWMVERNVSLSDSQSIEKVGTIGWWWGTINDHEGVYIHCPYAVGDELVPQREPRFKIDGSEQIPYRTITNVEAKTLGEMTEPDALMAGMEFLGVPASDMEAAVHKNRIIEWWNARYPEQPRDANRWCWKLGLVP